MRSIDKQLMLACAVLLLTACAGTPTRTGEPISALGKREGAIAEQSYKAAIDQMQQGRFAGAEKTLLEMTRRWPMLSGPYANLGLIYLRQGDPAKAEPVLSKAVAVNPKNGAAWNALGLVRRGKGDFEGAEQAYRQAISAAPESAEAHRNLGILYDLYLDRPKEALAEYRSCQRLTQDDDKALSQWIAVVEKRVKTGVAGRTRP